MSAYLDEGKLLKLGFTLDLVQVIRQAHEGDFSAQDQVKLPIYTLATLPDVVEGGKIYVSDATRSVAAGGTATGTECFGDASNWIDVTTGAAVV